MGRRLRYEERAKVVIVYGNSKMEKKLQEADGRP
jgi:hypothetical protein